MKLGMQCVGASFSPEPFHRAPLVSAQCCSLARMRSEGYGTWYVSVYVFVFVCYHVFSDYAQRHNEKSKRKSQYANEYSLTAVL